MKREHEGEAVRKHCSEKKKTCLQSKNLIFIFCAGASSWADTQFITLSTDLLELTQIELKWAWHAAVKTFFHTLVQSQTFRKVVERVGGSSGSSIPCLLSPRQIWSSSPLLHMQNQLWSNLGLKKIHMKRHGWNTYWTLQTSWLQETRLTFF